ncbi:MAG: hypothetical protein R3A10_06705 [Caldilineaceae bacterium]
MCNRQQPRHDRRLIHARFNHATNSGIGAQERWNLPNVFSVQQTQFPSIDVGLMQTAITDTVQLLDSHFTSHWTDGDPHHAHGHARL